MPEVTLKKKDLPKGHPALTSEGKWKPEAKALLKRHLIPSRISVGESDDPIRNTQLFYRVAAFLELFPESYNQSTWGEEYDHELTPCGTAFCIAGHAVHETGWNATVDYDWTLVQRPGLDKTLYSSRAALVELGLTDIEADLLFSSSWRPSEEFTVPEALRMLGDGECLSEITIDDGTFYLGGLQADEEDRTIRTTGIKE